MRFIDRVETGLFGDSCVAAFTLAKCRSLSAFSQSLDVLDVFRQLSRLAKRGSRSFGSRPGESGSMGCLGSSERRLEYIYNHIYDHICVYKVI